MAGSLFQSLAPGERRLVTGIGLVLFIGMNMFFVWPQIRQLGPLGEELNKLRGELARYQQEVSNARIYQRRLIELQSKGLSVVPAERSITLLRLVQDLARQHSVTITGTQPLPGSRGAQTNQFFEEQIIRVSYDASTEALVGFLYELGERHSMVLVRTLEIRPSARRYSLQGHMEIVAHYRKQRSERSTAREVAWNRE